MQLALKRQPLIFEINRTSRVNTVSLRSQVRLNLDSNQQFGMMSRVLTLCDEVLYLVSGMQYLVASAN
jgi:hypothetical protein